MRPSDAARSWVWVWCWCVGGGPRRPRIRYLPGWRRWVWRGSGLIRRAVRGTGGWGAGLGPDTEHEQENGQQREDYTAGQQANPDGEHVRDGDAELGVEADRGAAAGVHRHDTVGAVGDCPRQGGMVSARLGYPERLGTGRSWLGGTGGAGQGQVKRREGHVGCHIVADPAEVAVHGGGRADADEDVLSGSGRGGGGV